MTATRMIDVLPKSLRSTRGWLVGAVATTGVAAGLSVAWAANTTGNYSGYLEVVGISVTLGSAETAYLAWCNWTYGERALCRTVTAAASLGSLLILLGAIVGATSQGFVAGASGVGLLGMATAVGLVGVYRATGKSTAATLTAMIIMAGLAYFASVLWAAVS